LTNSLESKLGRLTAPSIPNTEELDVEVPLQNNKIVKNLKIDDVNTEIIQELRENLCSEEA
jgi:hypothetical protein